MKIEKSMAGDGKLYRFIDYADVPPIIIKSVTDEFVIYEHPGDGFEVCGRIEDEEVEEVPQPKERNKWARGWYMVFDGKWDLSNPMPEHTFNEIYGNKFKRKWPAESVNGVYTEPEE